MVLNGVVKTCNCCKNVAEIKKSAGAPSTLRPCVLEQYYFSIKKDRLNSIAEA